MTAVSGSAAGAAAGPGATAADAGGARRPWRTARCMRTARIDRSYRRICKEQTNEVKSRIQQGTVLGPPLF